MPITNLKIALYADSEGGKTLQIGHLIERFGAENVGIISCESGLTTISSRINPDYVKQCDSLDDLRKAFGWAKERFTRADQWVCVDGGSRVLQWVRDENWGNAEQAAELLMEGKRRDMLSDGLKPYARFVTKDMSLDGQRIWIQVGMDCERLMDAFIKLPSSVYWNFWEELTSKGQYEKGLPWKPDTPGNGAFNSIRRAFDYVFRLTREGELITAQCSNSPKAFAKKRDDWEIVKVPSEIKDFNLATFVERVQGTVKQ
jgi:hypothetical protein